MSTPASSPPALPLADGTAPRPTPSSKAPPRLEQFGARFVRERAAVPSDVSLRWAHERDAFRRLQWLACGRAALSGVVTSGAVATAEVLASARWPEGHFDHQWRWWSLVLGATAVFAVAEIAFLIWNALDATSRTARMTGVRDWTRLDRPLARAALELPNPRDGHPAVDPLRESSKLALLVLTLLYKAKLAATNFILKQLFKRMLGRAAVRGFLPFVAVPVTAVWNVIVTLRILRQARVRAVGPRAVEQAVALLFPRTSEGEAPSLSAAESEAVLRAVGSAIVRTRDLHPNLEHLLHELERRLLDRGTAPSHPERLDDPQRFLAQLRTLEPSARDRALLALGLACALDGRIGRRECALLTAAHAVCERPCDLDDWRRTAKAVREGAPIAAA